MDFKAAIENLTQKFTSGNNVPVERSMILRSEFDAIMDELAKKGLVELIKGDLTNGG